MSFKNLYTNRLSYIFLYLFTFVWWAVSSKKYSEDISFQITLFIFLIFFYYISYKRLKYSILNEYKQKLLFTQLLLPFIFILIGIIIWFIIIYFDLYNNTIFQNYFKSDKFNFVYNWLIVLYPLLFLLHFVSFILITITKIDNNKLLIQNKSNLLIKKIFSPLYFSDNIKKNFQKNENKIWFHKKLVYIYILFIPFLIIILQFNHNLFYKKYIEIWNIEKVDIKTLNSSNNLLEILKLDIEIFNKINWWKVDKLDKIELLEKQINIDEIQNILILNNNTMSFSTIWYKYKIWSIDQNSFNKNYNIFYMNDYIWDMYLVNNDLDYIYQCVRLDECFINIKKIEEKLFIVEDWVIILILYLVFWFIFLKIFPNIFIILYYIFLSFSVLFLLAKKYIKNFFPKLIIWIKKLLKKLEETNENLKKEK